MGASRTLAGQHLAQRHDVGDLVTRIALPNGTLRQVDPFLVLTHHGPQIYPPGNGGLPYGPHPHRGFETVTFIRAGSLAHGDSGGHASVIHAGGVQWMTAGSGIVHNEVATADFRRTGGPLEILQLWVNLPSRLKSTPPRYSGVEADAIPAMALDGDAATLHLIAGDFAGRSGPIRPLTGVFMSMVEISAGATVQLPAPAARSVLLYVLRGRGRLAGSLFEPWTLLDLNADGDAIIVEAIEEVSLIFGHADPIGEPVVSHGPFVMNTIQEIEDSFRDYRDGRFGNDRALLEVGR